MTEQKTTVDWLRFRTQADPQTVLQAIKPLYGDLGTHLKLKGLERGMMGFKHATEVVIGDMVLGRIDYGGDSQRGWARVDLPGKACQWVTQWDELENLERLPQAELRRLDVALTTWDGELSHELVVKAHDDGRFTTRGRPPLLRQIIHNDPRAGRTCEIGKREKSDKFMRCYEKGYEMASKSRGQTISIGGHPVEGIYRCEVEFKATGTEIPWEVVERRDQYFAGAYPFCSDVLPNVEADILMRRPEREPQTDLAVALENCRIQFGPTLFTAMMAYHGDMTAVWDKVIGNHHNQSLLDAGVLLVDHE
jgi:DNA relaxase NicK